MTASGFIITQNALFDCGVDGTSIFNTPAMEYSGLDAPCLHIEIWEEWISGPNRPVKRDQS